MNRRSYTFILMLAAGLAAIAALWVGQRLASPPQKKVADLAVPQLAGAAVNGRVLFGKYCSSCHGQVGEGTNQGPPLIHKIYESSHHADEAFFAAALLGVRAHHWSFGNMPKVEGITEREVGDIVAFVRQVQAANGIN